MSCSMIPGNGAARTLVRRTVVALAFLIATIFHGSVNAEPEKRVALVIGVAHYQHIGVLGNPANDAHLIAPALEKVGFDVQLLVDPDHETLLRGLREFRRRLAGATTALLYYAGHSVQVAGRNYLLPTNANINEVADLRYEAFDIQGVLDEEMDAPTRVKLVILDSCRDNPLSRSLAAHAGTRSADVVRGLSPMETQIGGTLIAYATAPDQVAADGTGKNSPFTEALARHIGTPGLDIRQRLTRVRADVQSATNGRQRPWVNESLDADFFLVPAAPAPPRAAPTATTEIVFWQSIVNSDNSADFAAYLQQFPKGDFAQLARSRIAALARKQSAPAVLEAKLVPPGPTIPSDSAAREPAETLSPRGEPDEAARLRKEQQEASRREQEQFDDGRLERERQIAEQRAIAAALAKLGYSRGPIDADDVSALRDAIHAMQSIETAEPTGVLTAEQRDRLLRDADLLSSLLSPPAKSPKGTPASAVKGAQARFDRGWAFETGKGQPQDAAEAAYWYGLAASDIAAARTNLGTLRAREGDTEAARLLWQTAAARGEGSAAFNLGALAERGFNGPVNPRLARRWYERGAELGNTDSAAALKRLGG